MTRRTDLSIIVVSWNTEALLRDCLDSVYADLGAHPALAADILVVDNASSDGSVEMVRERFPETHVVANTENAGFARANNQAIASCKGRWVMLLNSDTRVCPGSLQTLVRAADSDPKIGMVGPLLLNEDGTIQPSWARYAGPLAEFLGRYDRSEAPAALRAGEIPAEPLSPFSAGWLGGACLVARHAAIESVGALDEDYFMYCEEMDWCRRFRSAGWDIRLVPDARVIHLGGGSSRNAPRATRQRLADSKVLYFRRHGRPWHVAQALLLRALFLRRSSAEPQ